MEPLVIELLERHNKDKDLFGPKVQDEVKKLRKKYNIFNKRLKDDEQLLGLDWSEADLNNYKLDFTKLSDSKRKANFTKTSLKNVKLMESNLNYANFWMANLNSAELHGANLKGTNLSSAKLIRADFFNANLKGANLSMAVLNGAILSQGNLTGANLHLADLKAVILADGNLARADLHLANLEDAHLFRVNLTKANLRAAFLNRANLEEANLTDTHLEWAKLDGTNFYKTKFHDTILTDSNIDDAKNIEHTDLTNISINPDPCIAQNTYLALRNYFRKIGLGDRGGYYYYLFKKMEWKCNCKNKKWKNIVLGFFKDVLCGYGEHYWKVAIWMGVVILIYGLIYLYLGPSYFSGRGINDLFDYFYFSIVTFTTLGFGDVQPGSNSVILRSLAASEAIFGAGLLALFIVVLARRLTR